MKIGIVYTSTTPELIENVNQELYKQMGDKIEILNYEDPSILADIRAVGRVTTIPAARLVSLYMKAVSEGAEAVLNCCSSVGEVADATQNIGKYIGVPIVRIDEEMCREAIRLGKRIGVIATLSTTLEPTKNTLMRLAREMGKDIHLVDGLVDGAFGLNQEEFKKRVGESVEKILDKVDVVLLCQGSMAYIEKFLHETYEIPVVSSPRFGAIELKKALEMKGYCFK